MILIGLVVIVVVLATVQAWMLRRQYLQGKINEPTFTWMVALTRKLEPEDLPPEEKPA